MVDYSILKQHSTAIRHRVVDMTHDTGTQGAHIGGSLSCVEIMTVLYGSVMHITPELVKSEERDRFVLSKGHCAIAHYATLREYGFVTEEQVKSFKYNDSVLHTHPVMNLDIGIEFSTGSLGQGFAFAVGTALALKKKGNLTSRVYSLVGDGECNEGQIWESAMTASHHKLDNLTVVVDKNGLQNDDFTATVLNMGDLAQKWSSFGFDVVEIDGHNLKQLVSALGKRSDKPIAIIADTVKGKGVSFIENNAAWHNRSLSEEQYATAVAELEVTNG